MKLLPGYYQKKRRKSSKKNTHVRYQNLSEENEIKKRQYCCE